MLWNEPLQKIFMYKLNAWLMALAMTTLDAKVFFVNLLDSQELWYYAVQLLGYIILTYILLCTVDKINIEVWKCKKDSQLEFVVEN